MQLGFVSAIFADLALEDVLKFAADEDYECVELMCWPEGPPDRKYAGVTHLRVADFTQGAADDVNALCEKTSVKISGLGYYPNILSSDEEESRIAIEHLKKVIRAAQLLGLKNVNTFIGNDHHRPLEYNFSRFRQIWPELIRFAKDHEIFIGIENCPMLFSADEWPGGKNMARSPAVWRKMFAAIPSDHFGLNYDPSHFVLQMMDYLEPIVEFKQKLFHAHAKDMKIERDRLNAHGILDMGWSTPKIPGLGHIDWSAFISALTDVGYAGPVCVEVEDEAFRHNLALRKRSLRIAHNVLRPLIG
jgi:sugar phosphate isomerase/epimerase